MRGAALLAVEIGDPESTRTVIAIIALLCVIGVALIMLAFWLRRVTRPDPELLAPLELMGERSWRRADPVGQRRRLDDVRPDGAEPLTRAAAPPKLDAAFDAGPSSPGFEDLRSPSSEPKDSTSGADDADAPRTDGAPLAHGVDEPDDAEAGAEAGQGEGVVAARVGAEPVVDEPDDAEAGAEAGQGEGVVAARVGAEPVVDEPDDAELDDVEPDGQDEEPSSRTPMAINRSVFDDLFADLTDGDIDPEALARARAELDAELRQDAKET